MSFFPSLRKEGAQLKDIQAPFSEIYTLWGRFSEALMRGPGPLSVAERELIAAYTSGTNKCNYCFHDHTMAAEHFGIDVGVLEALMKDVGTAPGDDKMKPLLRYVAKLTAAPAQLTQADADAAGGRHPLSEDAAWHEAVQRVLGDDASDLDSIAAERQQALKSSAAGTGLSLEDLFFGDQPPRGPHPPGEDPMLPGDEA